MKGTGMLVGNFELNPAPKGDQSGRGSSFIGPLKDTIVKETDNGKSYSVFALQSICNSKSNTGFPYLLFTPIMRPPTVFSVRPSD